MKRLAILYLYICSFPLFSCYAQNKTLDSLWKAYHNQDKTDTSRLNALQTIAWSLRDNNPDTAIILAKEQVMLAAKLSGDDKKLWTAKAFNVMGISFMNKRNFQTALPNYLQGLKLFDEIGDKKGAGNSYSNIGVLYMEMNQYSKAIDYFDKGLKILKESNNKKGLSNCYGNMGIVYWEQANYPKAMNCLLNGLKIKEELGDKPGIASCYNTLALIYKDQHDYPKSLGYLSKARAIYEETNDKRGLGNALANIGLTYYSLNDYPKALDCFSKALKLGQEIGFKKLQANTYGNIGLIYHQQTEYPKALDCYLKQLRIARETGDEEGTAASLLNIGELYNEMKDYQKNILYNDTALQIGRKINVLSIQRAAYGNLSKGYSNAGKYKEAYENHLWFKTLTDSIFNAENSKQLGDLKTSFEVEKKETQLKLEAKADAAIYQEEKKRQKLVFYAVVCVLTIVVVFVFFLYRRFKLTQRQMVIIEKQKTVVEEQKLLVEHQKKLADEHQREIIDSITYARRLQQAILPPAELIDKYLPQNFVYYKPKDIVAGDFYWMEHLDNITFIAAADSTGHGVPGAMVSVVCSNALNRAVKEFGLRETGKILDKTRELVLETFEKSGEEIKDGMDISLMRIHSSDSHITAQWSGANNQLWYKKEQGDKILEIKADKQPIGQTDQAKPFTTHLLEPERGDIFYLMTDGYADQFGGEKGKKFKYKQLEELLLENSKKELNEQKTLLGDSFDNWKGNLEQIDDVTILGIRIH